MIIKTQNLPKALMKTKKIKMRGRMRRKHSKRGNKNDLLVIYKHEINKNNNLELKQRYNVWMKISKYQMILCYKLEV